MAAQQQQVQKLSMAAPDDWHHHFRDEPVLQQTVRFAARTFERCVAMPNLKPPVTTTALALAYRERIIAQLKDDQMEPLMTLYLQETTTREEIRKAKKSGFVFGCKMYPAGATTNSHAGVSDVTKCYGALEEMSDQGLPLLIHGEAVGDHMDIFDCERVFLEETLPGIVGKFPKLRIVLEHITTREAAEYVLAAPSNVAATVTAHHLLYNRNALLMGGLKPHFYCMPILKAEDHRVALLNAVTSGSKKFFLGTDSAPHEISAKHSACGCAGIFTAHAALELYAEAFDRVGALDKLEAFASFNGPDFHKMPRNTKRVELERKCWRPPKTYEFGTGLLVPLRADQDVLWTVNTSL